MCFQDNATKSVKRSKPAPKRFKVSCLDDIGKAIDALLNSDTQAAQFGRYQVVGDLLVYRAPVTDDLKIPADRVPALIEMIKTGTVVLVEPPLAVLETLADSLNVVALDSKRESGHWDRPGTVKAKVRRIKQDIVAKRVRQPDGSTLYIGNSSVLGLIGRYVSFGRESVNRSETEIQRRLSRLIPMVPFSVFEQAGLDLNAMRILERGPAETVERKREAGTDRKTGKPKYKLETVHFTGASLFQVGDACFLFDLDRRELAEKVFNPFLVKLPNPVRTIAEAYASLKPAEFLSPGVKRVGADTVPPTNLLGRHPSPSLRQNPCDLLVSESFTHTTSYFPPSLIRGLLGRFKCSDVWGQRHGPGIRNVKRAQRS